MNLKKSETSSIEALKAMKTCGYLTELARGHCIGGERTHLKARFRQKLMGKTDWYKIKSMTMYEWES